MLETYLSGCEEKEDSGVASTEQPSSENTSTPTGDDSKDEEITIDEDVETEIQDLRDRIHLLEKIAKMNKKLEKEEENLVRLFINIERCKKSDEVIGDLRVNLEKLKNENERNELEYNENSKALIDLETALSSRKCYLKQLLNDVDRQENGGGENGGKLSKGEKARSKPSPQMSGVGELSASTVEKDYYSLPCREKPVLDTLV